MKRLIIGLISALLMTAGLVGVSETSATAACPSYTGCVKTYTHVTGPKVIKKGKAGRFCVTVTTRGNGKPRGTVTLNIKRSKGAFEYTATKPYHGKNPHTDHVHIGFTVDFADRPDTAELRQWVSHFLFESQP